MVLDRSRVSPLRNSPPGPPRSPRQKSDYIQSTGPVGLEARLIDNLCKPVLEYTPSWVSPNAISLANFGLNWGVLWLSLERPADPLQNLLGACLCGLGMIWSMILDCLDGMQARKTNQCSKLGELLDHALDAISVPISVAAVSFTIHMWHPSGPAVPMAYGIAASSMIYNAQLVLYHHTGKFLHSDITTGTEGQFVIGLTHIGFALWKFGLIHAGGSMWSYQIGSWLWCLGSLCGTVRVHWFYLEKLIGLGVLLPHLFYQLSVAGLIWLFVGGWLSPIQLVLVTAAISFRLNGAYVMTTLFRERFAGRDWGLLAWMAWAVYDMHEPMQIEGKVAGSIGLLAGYAVLCNLAVLSRHTHAL